MGTCVPMHLAKALGYFASVIVLNAYDSHILNTRAISVILLTILATPRGSKYAYIHILAYIDQPINSLFCRSRCDFQNKG